MQLGNIYKALSVFFTFGIIVCLYLLIVPQTERSTIAFFATPTPFPTATPTPTPIPLGHPVLLTIPSIGITAPIESLGYAPDGSMATPTDPAHVGWFTELPKPGEKGSAVIAGHYDDIHGQPAVFYYLDTVAVGETISITYDSGQTRTFVVQDTTSLPISNELADTIFGQCDGICVNIVTCSGIWDRAHHNYKERRVLKAAAL